MNDQLAKIQTDREILRNAHAKGKFATLGAFIRLSGPGWLQSAITLGGGSLASALYLGVLGGTHMLWLQLVAIVVGVIMLSAISYVTLSTGERPYQAINEHINPVLGVGWITATIMANMIWCMSQYSLCFDVLNRNLATNLVEDTSTSKIAVSIVILLLTSGIVFLSIRGGKMSRAFDLLLKALVGMIVICFFAVVAYLAKNGDVNWRDVFTGFIPNLSQWNNPATEISKLIQAAPEGMQTFWTEAIKATQRDVMISTTATAVGINMTFLLPYSMLKRGWDRPFRGLATFDLSTGMAIPYLLVTTCIVIASATSFHAKADAEFLSTDPGQITTSSFFDGAWGPVAKRYAVDDPDGLAAINKMKEESPDEIVGKNRAKAEYIATLSQEERKLAISLVKPNSAQLAKSLEPLLGERVSNLVFGLGAFGMGFSTIIILMLINGFAISELVGKYESDAVQFIGCLIAGVSGACWMWAWTGESRTWLVIMASTFGAMLLPIAYVAFFALMNSKSLLGVHKPTGGTMILWNVLMAFGVIAAFAQAISAIRGKMADPQAGPLVIGGAITFVLLAIVGFSARPKIRSTSTTDQ